MSTEVSIENDFPDCVSCPYLEAKLHEASKSQHQANKSREEFDEICQEYLGREIPVDREAIEHGIAEAIVAASSGNGESLLARVGGAVRKGNISSYGPLLKGYVRLIGYQEKPAKESLADASGAYEACIGGPVTIKQRGNFSQRCISGEQIPEHSRLKKFS